MLETYLENMGFVLRKQGRSMGSSRCPCCGAGGEHGNRLCIFSGTDGRQRWKCHACGARGDLADAIAALEGLPLVAALTRARVLSGDTGGTSATWVQPKRVSAGAAAGVASRPATANAPLQTRPEVDADLGADLIRAWRDKLPMWEPEAGAELMRRGLSKDTLMRAMHIGLLRMLPENPSKARSLLIEAAKGGDRMSASGLWAGNSSAWPAQSFRPLVFIAPDCKSIEFRQGGKSPSKKAVAGEERKYPKSIRLGRIGKPYIWAGDKGQCVIVEGVIDMLSLVQMGEKRTIMAIPGASAWRGEWLLAAHRAYGTSFIIALDADDAGDKSSQRIASLLTEYEIPHTRLRPENGHKDWNDVLMAKVAASVPPCANRNNQALTQISA